LTREEIDDPKKKEARAAYDKEIQHILGPAFDPADVLDDETPGYERYMDEDTEPVENVDTDDLDQKTVDYYLHAEALLPIAGELERLCIESVIGMVI
jgi:hypothetical protein